MKSLNLRIVLLFAFCGVAALSVLWFPAGQDNVLALESENETAAASLAIGSPAPKLDIEHWIQDGNGFFKPVTGFKPGNVYVVEFWATWCPPCVASMPHLAELQNRYRGQNVQIVSVSDEPLDTVESFLKRKTDRDGEEMTFDEITAAYSLTTDPDRSTHEAYMEAAKQDNIPTAFLVGKDGFVEWIGHPMEIDQPLEAVVNGKWNRQEFAEMYEFRAMIPQLSRLANSGQMDEAIALVEKQFKKTQSAEIQAQLVGIKQQLKMMSGQIDDEVTAYFQKQLDSGKGDPMTIVRMAASLYQMTQLQDDEQLQPGAERLINKAIDAIKREVDGAEKDLHPAMYDTLAHLQQSVGDLDAAIESQQAAIDSAPAASKERLNRFLEELKEAKEGGGEGDTK